MWLCAIASPHSSPMFIPPSQSTPSSFWRRTNVCSKLIPFLFPVLPQVAFFRYKLCSQQRISSYNERRLLCSSEPEACNISRLGATPRLPRVELVLMWQIFSAMRVSGKVCLPSFASFPSFLQATAPLLMLLLLLLMLALHLQHNTYREHKRYWGILPQQPVGWFDQYTNTAREQLKWTKSTISTW